MIDKLVGYLRSALEYPFIRQTRRNHGLEHATIHILNQRVKGLRVAGRSMNSGFILVGDIPTEEVDQAARDALKRMRDGEHNLAVHPNCGTNLVTTGIFTALVGLIGFGRGYKRLSLDRFSKMVTMMTLAVLVSQPLGANIQKHVTTKGDPGDLVIAEVRRHEFRWPFGQKVVVAHYISTQKG